MPRVRAALPAAAAPPSPGAEARALLLLQRARTDKNAAGVVTVMRANTAHVAVLHQALLDVAKLDARTAVRAGALPAVVAAMRAYAADAQLQQRGADVLINLSAQHLERAEAAGALQVHVSAIVAHPGHEGAQSSCCWALACVADIDAPKVVAAGGLAALVGVLGAPSTRAGTVKWASLALIALSRHEASLHSLLAAGCLDATVAALAAHGGSDEEACAACCRLLFATAGVTPRGPPVTRPPPAAVADAVLTAASGHPRDAYVQAKAMEALRFVCQGPEGGTANLDCVAVAATSVLRAHPADRAACEAACTTLQALLSSVDAHGRRRCAVDVGALPVLAGALHALSRDKDVNTEDRVVVLPSARIAGPAPQHSVQTRVPSHARMTGAICGALANVLFRCDADMLAAAEDAYVVSPALALLQLHPRHEEAQSGGLGLLGALVTHSNATPMTAEGIAAVLHVAQEAQRTHPHSAYIYDTAARICVRLLTQSPPEAPVLAELVAPPVSDAPDATQLDAHSDAQPDEEPDEQPVPAAAAAAPRSQLDPLDDMVSAARASDWPAVFAMMREHEGSFALQQRGCALLLARARFTEPATCAGAIEAAVAALRVHGARADASVDLLWKMLSDAPVGGDRPRSARRRPGGCCRSMRRRAECERGAAAAALRAAGQERCEGPGCGGAHGARAGRAGGERTQAREARAEQGEGSRHHNGCSDGGDG
jgi:hypothetical protein